MVNTRSPPEAWTIFVIGLDFWKALALLYVCRVVCIESYEDESGSPRISALVGLRGEVLIQLATRVRMEHVLNCDA